MKFTAAIKQVRRQILLCGAGLRCPHCGRELAERAESGRSKETSKAISRD